MYEFLHEGLLNKMCDFLMMPKCKSIKDSLAWIIRESSHVPSQQKCVPGIQIHFTAILENIYRRPANRLYCAKNKKNNTN